MFKSYEYIDYLGYDETTKQYRHRYKIIDTDFEEVAVGVGVGVEVGVAVAVAVGVEVIDVYTKRNLPVAPNLFRCMLYVKEKYGWTIDRQVEWHRKYNPRWQEVEEAMQMYLTFS